MVYIMCVCVCFRAAIACLGALFEQLGRMLVGSFKDALTNLLKAMKSAEVCLLLRLTSSKLLSVLPEKHTHSFKYPWMLFDP